MLPYQTLVGNCLMEAVVSVIDHTLKLDAVRFNAPERTRMGQASPRTWMVYSAKGSHPGSGLPPCSKFFRMDGIITRRMARTSGTRKDRMSKPRRSMSLATMPGAGWNDHPAYKTRSKRRPLLPERPKMAYLISDRRRGVFLMGSRGSVTYPPSEAHSHRECSWTEGRIFKGRSLRRRCIGRIEDWSDVIYQARKGNSTSK